MLKEPTAETSFTRIEEQVRRLWRLHAVPDEARALRDRGAAHIIYQQPLVTARQPWADQIRLLATTDLLARYRTMRGDAVQRQTGWACHGLPVEMEVEHSLGPDAASYDLAQFGAACRATAMEGMRQGEALAEWLGAWLDPAHTYCTLTPQVIDIVWGAMRQLWDAGHVNHVHRVVPYCPRCATPLSDAETTRRTVEIEASSAWLYLPWDGEADAYILTWTPDPWMLVGMVALAAHPQAEYVLVELARQEDRPSIRLLLAEAALDRTRIGPHSLVRKLPGRSLRAARYHPPFTFRPVPEGTGRVMLSEMVPLDQGTGILAVTPTFDGLSLALAQTHDLPLPDLMDESGKLSDQVTPWRGLSPQESEPFLLEVLEARGLLFREESRLQSRPLCPYCETLLLPRACEVWQVETASGPWTVSRDRAWGAPLPVWVCQSCAEQQCLSSIADLAYRAGLDVDQLDPHRPMVDRLIFACDRCGGTMRRVTAVMDAAFEASVLPWSLSPQPGPAEHSPPTVAVGLGDRDIGWLGDLTEMAALLRGSLAFEQAVALPEGEADALQNLERATPADALRWAVYADTTPEQAERGFMRPLWQLAVLPGSAPEGKQDTGAMPVSGEKAGEDHTSELFDRWLAARLHRAIATMTKALEACHTDQAARELASLADDLCNWYAPHRPGGIDGSLELLGRLLAPFVPHLAEAIYRQSESQLVSSVHAATWPRPDPAWHDEGLLSDMALTRQLAALGQSARAQAGLKANQPVRRALVGPLAGEPEELSVLTKLLVDALQVDRVELLPGITDQVTWHLTLKPGQTVERGFPPAELDAALAALASEAAADLVAQLWQGISIGLDVLGQAVTLLPDEVSVQAQAPPGWAAAAADGYLVMLSVE